MFLGASHSPLSFCSYTTLGLLHTLSPLSSGGTEKRQETSAEFGSQSEQQSSLSESPGHDEPINHQGFGRIIRDETGSVVRIEVNEDRQSSVDKKVTQMDMERFDPVVDPNVLFKWSMTGSATYVNDSEGQNPEVAEGQCHASSTLPFLAIIEIYVLLLPPCTQPLGECQLLKLLPLHFHLPCQVLVLDMPPRVKQPISRPL